MPDLNKIRAFAFDVDGVMTDGGIQCDLDGNLFRVFDAKDGFAIRMASMKGYPVGVITGGRSISIRKRFLGSGVPQEDIFLGSRDKIKDFRRFCDIHGLDASEVMYFGDDTPDCEVLLAAGIGVAPADAAQDAIEAADIVSSRPGGKGCFREMAEKVLRMRGDWTFDAALYEKKF